MSQFRQLNKNVKLTFIFSFFQSLGRGIWAGNILTAFIYFFADSSTITVGWTSVATGVAFTLTLLPSGFLADIYRRDYLLKLAAIFGIISVVVLMFANSLLMIFVALTFWGLAQGTTRPALESSFADSLPSGSRSGIYSKLHLVRNGAQAIGPFLNIIIFIFIGDQWDLVLLRIVMLVGLFVSLGSILSLFFFDDNQSMGSISEAIEEVGSSEETAIPTITKRRQYIPAILVLSNIMVGAGAGMTLKYFPLFFIDIYNLKPIAVNGILGSTSIFTGIAAIFAQKWSLKNGRVIIIIAVQGLATICLFALSLYPVMFLLVPIFIARGSLMNAAQPLSRSILMDYIPKRNRGKWNSLEALAWGMFWNASAVVGGYLIDDISYAYAFRITAVIYMVGILPLFTLIPLVRQETPLSEKLEQTKQMDEIEEVNENEEMFEEAVSSQN